MRKIIISMGYDEEVTYMITVHGGQVNISKDNSTIVFTECKYRSNNRYGYAIEAVDVRKQHKISRVALFFCTRYGYTSFPCRFDVIGIDRNNRITHIKNAFDYR